MDKKPKISKIAKQLKRPEASRRRIIRNFNKAFAPKKPKYQININPGCPLDGLEYALRVVDELLVLKRTYDYEAALNDVRTCLMAARNRVIKGESMEALSVVQSSNLVVSGAPDDFIPGL